MRLVPFEHKSTKIFLRLHSKKVKAVSIQPHNLRWKDTSQISR
ncbi:hypothetical protein LMANV2_320091 [Leptospira interrogans serovar Manilae]|uniref:Uncharacterized protein n=1 Tax=Leptospira interrogans serovar Manilae TaxID=214675 RepID=A0AAQ1NZI6_LEPIR|nr:hypothetical protein LMANV2_320091 [Leptospira interrogans serovar Manilae]